MREDDRVWYVAMSKLQCAPFLLFVAFAACGAEVPVDLQAFVNAAMMGKVDEIAAGLAAHPEWAKQATASGSSALHGAAMMGRLDVAKKLLAAGADVSAVEVDSGKTVLHLVAENGRDEFLDYLLNQKVSLEVPDNNGRTPLHAACWSSDANGYVVRKLLDAGAAIEASDRGATPILLASIRGNTELVKILIKQGANVNAQAEDGRKPLAAALDGHHEETAKVLAAAGAK
jgi:ankyrin repeat protein